MKVLVAMDACLEAYDLYYGTPLHVACANDYTECVKVLLNAGERQCAAGCGNVPNQHGFQFGSCLHVCSSQMLEVIF